MGFVFFEKVSIKTLHGAQLTFIHSIFLQAGVGSDASWESWYVHWHESGMGLEAETIKKVPVHSSLTDPLPSCLSNWHIKCHHDFCIEGDGLPEIEEVKGVMQCFNMLISSCSASMPYWYCFESWLPHLQSNYDLGSSNMHSSSSLARAPMWRAPCSWLQMGSSPAIVIIWRRDPVNERFCVFSATLTLK